MLPRNIFYRAFQHKLLYKVYVNFIKMNFMHLFHIRFNQKRYRYDLNVNFLQDVLISSAGFWTFAWGNVCSDWKERHLEMYSSQWLSLKSRFLLAVFIYLKYQYMYQTKMTNSGNIFILFEQPLYLGSIKSTLELDSF